MKSTGIVRKMDKLGRVVIPIELRRTLNIDVKDSLEIYVDDDQIILTKYKGNAERNDILSKLQDLTVQTNDTNTRDILNRVIEFIK